MMEYYGDVRVARLFDLQNEDDPVLYEEQQFFLQEIDECDGPVLDIGCGTGRILLAAMERGRSLVGFDASGAFLEELRLKAQQKNLTGPLPIFQTQMQTLALRENSVTLAICAFRTFNHLLTYEEQLDFLCRAREFLDPNQGRLLINLTNPDPMELQMMVGQKGLVRDDLIWHEDNLRVAWWAASSFDEQSHLIHQVYHYDFIEESGLVRASYQYPFNVQWISADEMYQLAEEAGFEVAHCWSEFQKEKFQIGTGDAIWDLRPAS